MYPRLASRARRCLATGCAAATIELPGSGDRPRLADAAQTRADLRRALTAGHPVDKIVDRLVIPLGIRLAVVEPAHCGRRSFVGRFVPRSMLTRPVRSRSRCTSCCSGTTKQMNGSGQQNR